MYAVTINMGSVQQPKLCYRIAHCLDVNFCFKIEENGKNQENHRRMCTMTKIYNVS